MFHARLRLGALWLSQSARALADYCLRSFVVLEVARSGQTAAAGSWHQVAPFAVLPFVFCAPFHGPLCTSRSPRRLMLASTMGCLLVALTSGLLLGPGTNVWLWCAVIALTAAGHALYSPARYAVLPPAAWATGWPVARLLGWMEGGSALGIVGGLLLGWRLHGGDSAWLTAGGLQIPAAVLAVVLINLGAWLFVWPVTFDENDLRQTAWRKAAHDFFRDARRVLVDQDARPALLGLAYLMALVAVTAGALVAYSLQDDSPVETASLPWVFITTSLGAALGSAAASWQSHPRRGMGFAAPSCLLLACTMVFLLLGWLNLGTAALLMGCLAGLVNAPFRTAFLASLSGNLRGNALAIMNACIYLAMSCASAVFFVLTRTGLLGVQGQLILVAALVALGGIVGLIVFKRETIEQLLEFILWPLYRIRARGPGLAAVPFRGPAIIIANHAAWLDPIWLGKVMPPTLTPLMTSRFFDKPGLGWIMKGMNAAIRVEDTGKLRRDIPELDAAIELLDRGGTVLIFPEGYMRRKDELVLRRFGQGIWRILCKRPQIPVFPCWIDGGWCSFFSYWHGLPTKNKRMDWWRSIDIGVSEALVLNAETLADMNETRQRLMQACLEARRWLGREPYSLGTVDNSEPDGKNEETATES